MHFRGANGDSDENEESQNANRFAQEDNMRPGGDSNVVENGEYTFENGAVYKG